MARKAEHSSPLASERQLSLAQRVEDFLIDARARGLSPRTIEAYETRLKKVLLPFCERETIASPADLTRSALNKLSLELQAAGPGGAAISRVSISSYLNTVNIWLNWCQREGDETSARARLPRLERKLLDVLTKEEIAQLVDAAVTERDRLIIRVLADTGVRAGELLGIRVRDLVERDRHLYLQVRGKGMRERLVPIPDRDIARGLLRLTRGLEDNDRIFRTIRQRDGDYRPMSLDALEGMLRTLRQRAGLQKRVYAHLFRHSFATRALKPGDRQMSPIQLARVLGHSSLRMIDEVYSHLNAEDSFEAMQRLLGAER